MTLVDIRRPYILSANTLDENRRWQKQTLDNLDRVNGKFAIATQVQLTHGTTTTITSPLPEGMTIGSIVPTYCLGYTPTTGATYTTLGIPRVDWQVNTNAAGIDLTPDFPLNHTQPCLIKTASADQSIPSGANTQLTGWDVTYYSRGSVISDNGTLFTLAEAGTYSVAVYIFMESSTYTGTQIIFTDGVAIDFPQQYLPATLNDGARLTAAGIIKATANQTFYAGLFQANAGALNHNVKGGANFRRIEFHRLYNNTIPTGKVTLLFIAA